MSADGGRAGLTSVSLPVEPEGRFRPPSAALRPLRVAMVLPGLGRVRRGAEVAFFRIARGLARDPGVRVELFGSGDEAPWGSDELPDVPLHRVACLGRERFERWPRFPPLRSEHECEELTFALGLWLGRAYDPDRFDAVLSCTYPFLNWYLQRAGGRNRPRHIFITQNGDWMVQARNSEYRFFGCDGLVCTNRVYYERHRGRHRSALIPNGVDLEIYHPRRRHDAETGHSDGLPGGPTPPGVPVALVASALVPSKNVDLAVRAASRIPGLFLMVAGDGPERARIAAMAAELLPGRHRLLGAVPPPQMPNLYRGADLFLHLSRDEPFGIVYLEAAASGLPAVVDDNPVTRWILDESALYADAGDVEAVASALSRAMTPGARDRLGASARARSEGWGWERQVAKYRDFIREVCSGSSCSPS